MPRLDRLISHATGDSRSRVRRAIRAAEVTVNGRPVLDPSLPLGADDEVRWRGELLTEPGPRYFMLHKPVGYECGRGDPVHRSVYGLLEAEPRVEQLHLVGRLDVDTTGLVLLTDDGDWSHRITAPRKKRPKSYRVRLAQAWSSDEPALAVLRAGVSLRGDDRPTAPAEVEWLGADDLRLVIHEGRYHQVKRMLAAVGNRVIALHRERIGALMLDPALPPGAYRPLSEAERELALSDTSQC